METLLQDVHFSVRVLRKSPGFTIAAVLTLALAIGANAVVFAALNAVILRSLNVPRAESLYLFQHVSDYSAAQSYPDYLDLRDRNRSFDGLAAYNITQAGLDTGDHPSRVWLYEASGNYFDVLGIQPYLGRFFHASDEHGPNSAPYIVLSYGYWHTHFQDDRGMLGRTVQVNKHPFTIIGVAPPGFHGTLMFFSPDFFLPLVNQEQVDGTNLLNARGNRWIFMAIGHLKAGVTPAQAADDVNSISSDLEKAYPKEHHHMPYALARPSLYGELLGRPVRAFLSALMLLAGLILLAACANLGSLFAARAADRSRSNPDLTARRRHRIMGQRGAVALAKRVAAISAISHQFAGKPRRKCLWSSFAAGPSQWIPFWRGPGKAGTAHGPIWDHQVGITVHAWASDHGPRSVGCGADCDLCRAGDFFSGCRARTGTFPTHRCRF
jgi:hypothetical protein